MKKYIANCITICHKCQQVKAEHRHLERLFQPFPIPEWKWEVISMDFTIGFLMIVRQDDSIMVMVDNMFKEENFIVVKYTYKVSDIADFFMKEFFKLHGSPKSIISD